MPTTKIEIIPMAITEHREKRRGDLLDILATVQFWRLRAVEFTLLSLIVFWLGFQLACML